MVRRVREHDVIKGGYRVYTCDKCGTEMIRKNRIIKPWGNRKRIFDVWCPKCETFSRNITRVTRKVVWE